MKAIDWQGSVVDSNVREYRKSDGGEWIRVGSFRPRDSVERKEGDVWGHGERQFRVERVTRSEALEHSGFDLVFEMMEVLAKRYGDECVRLVVWFDE